MRPRLPVAVAIMTALLMALGPAVAAESVVSVGGPVHETITLASGEWRAYRTAMNSIESLRIAVQVLQGGRIDVFSTNDVGFSQYTDPNSTVFSYYPEGSQTNTTSFPGNFAAPTGGEYFVIVDNTPTTSGGATPTGPVTLDVSLEKTSLLPFLLGLFGGIVAVGIGLILYLRSKRRKRFAALLSTPPSEPPTPPTPPPN